MARRTEVLDPHDLVRLLKATNQRDIEHSPAIHTQRPTLVQIRRAHLFNPWLLWDCPRYLIRCGAERCTLGWRPRR